MVSLSDKVLNEMDKAQLKDYIHLLHDVIRKQEYLYQARADLANTLETAFKYKNYELSCVAGLTQAQNIVEMYSDKIKNEYKITESPYPTFSGTARRNNE